MSKGHRIVGPYAWQVTRDKLKFWFVFVAADGWQVRQEVTIDRLTRALASRSRPVFDTQGTHSANFKRFPIPNDLSAYPSLAYPRGNKGGLIADAAISLLTGEDLADATRVRFFGILPETPRFKGDEPI